MKRALHLCFTSFGRVLDVVCVKSSRLRGQAWVVFADVPSATNALRGMQGSQFYDRPMARGPRKLGAAPRWPVLWRRTHLIRCLCTPRHVQRIAFARGKSDVVAKADGTWLPPDKRVKAAGARPTRAAWVRVGFAAHAQFARALRVTSRR
jgi:hypothetical protein